MTDDEIMWHISKNTRLNRVRLAFVDEAVRIIINTLSEENKLTDIEIQRMEFEAVKKIASELGVKL